MTQTSPLFECDRCPLARSASTARTQTEQRIIHDMHVHAHDHWVYVGYASGGLGFDVRLISRLLPQLDHAVTIIFIDQEYHALEPLRDHMYRITTDADIYTASTTSSDQEVIQRCQYAQRMIAQAHHNVSVHWLTTAAEYYRMINTNPQLRADLITWIDPDTRVEPHTPYADTDTEILRHCRKDRSYDYILTVDTHHTPQLIRTVYDRPLAARTVWNCNTTATDYAVYIGPYRVYPYDPIDGAVCINDTIYTSTSECSDAIRLLHELAHGAPLHTRCVPSHIHDQLMQLLHVQRRAE